MRARLVLQLVPAMLMPSAALAGRKVIIADGTASPSEQAAAAFMALLPIVAVLVFAAARWIEGGRRPEP